MITLFKGDDTGGLLGKSVVVEISTEFDLTGCTVIFNYQGVERRWENVHDGDRREVFFSHNETARMSVGVFKAVIVAVDSSGKVRTITNSLPIKVSTNLAECYGDNVARVTIGTTVNWDRITGKPFEGQEIDIGTDDKVLAALGTIIEKLGGTVKAGIALVALCAMSAFGYTPEAHTNSFERDGVTYAQRGGLGASDFVVTNIDASAVGAVKSVNGLKGDVVLSTANIKHGYSSLQNVINSVEGNTLRHIDNKNNPHAVTAAQVGAVPFVEDASGEKTAVTIGGRDSNNFVGFYSLANGLGLTASGSHSHAEGIGTTALGHYSHAEGIGTTASGAGSHTSGLNSQTLEGHDCAFAWNGDDTRISDDGLPIPYISHGPGTFNINPAGGLDGFWIGEQTLSSILTNKADKAAPSAANNLASLTADGNLADSGKTVGDFLPRVSNEPVRSTFDISGPLFLDMDGYIQLNSAGFIYGPFDNIQEEMGSKISLRTELDSKADLSMISATNTTFSNAVLAVGLNIDTNSVAVLNEIAKTFGGFPLGAGETATTVGGLLAALAAAAAWLKKNKVQTLKLNDNSVETSADGGVAKLDDFFTESNSLLTGAIDARLPYPLYAVPSTGLLKDRAINTTSLASVTVPDNFTDLLVRASVASSLSVTMPASLTKYGDTFPGEVGEYLITITKTGAAEAYVRTIKLEEVA